MFGPFASKCNHLSMREAQQVLEHNSEITLLDVRTHDEYRQGHIPGSINIPLDRLQHGLSTFLPEKNAQVFVYCLSGARSQSACAIMARSGYAHVTNIGGIMSWQGPTVAGAESGFRPDYPAQQDRYADAADR